MEGLGRLPEAAVEPALIVVVGLPGTGKSYFCARLAERLPVVVLESDVLRKTLFPSPDHSPAESGRLFRACHRLIERLLKRGVSVVLDATNLSERHREHLYSIAERLDITPILVRVEAPPEVVRRRLEERRGDPRAKSDAGWEVYNRMKPLVDKIRRNHYAVDTSTDITPVLDKIVRQVER